MTTRTPSHFPAYSTWLRAQKDDFLRQLMTRRPDVITPPPAGFDAVVQRLALRHSILRAVADISFPATLVLEFASDIQRAESRSQQPQLDRSHDGQSLIPVSYLHTALGKELTERNTPSRRQPTLSIVRQALEELRQIGLIYGYGPGGGAFTGKATSKSAATSSAPTQAADANRDIVALCPGVSESLHKGWSVLHSVTASEEYTDPTEAAKYRTQMSTSATAIVQALRRSHGLGVRPQDPHGPSYRILTELQEHAVTEPACARTLYDQIATDEVRLLPCSAALASAAHLPTTDGITMPSFRPPQGLVVSPHAPTPAPSAAAQSPDTLAQSGAAEAYEVLRALRALIIELSGSPAKTLKDSTVGVREVGRLAKAIGVDEIPDAPPADAESAASVPLHIGFLIELGILAGLLVIGPPQPEPLNDTGGDYLVATELADTWLSADLPDQWAHIVSSWYHCNVATWRFYLSDVDDGAASGLNPGAAELQHFTASRLRHRLISAALALAPVPTAPATEMPVGDGVAADDRLTVADALRWRHPQEASLAPRFALQTLGLEARMLGLIVDQRPTAIAFAAAKLPARIPGPRGVDPAWLGMPKQAPDEYRTLREACDKALPASADMLIAQGDMTVIAPSPLPPTSQAMMERIASVESPGLATVYRLDQTTLQAGLRSGLTVAEISAFLSQRMVGELPQSLEYVLRDLGHHRPGLRVGPARAILHCEDEATITALANHPAVAGLGARVIAPTVLSLQVSDGTARDTLLKAGFDIVAEDAEGNDIARGITPIRLASDALSPQPDQPREAEFFGARLAERVAVTLDSIRAASDSRERTGKTSKTATSGKTGKGGTAGRSGSAAASGSAASGTSSRLQPGQSAAEREEAVVGPLKTAAQQGRTVAISHLDRNGTIKHRRIKPVTVSPRHVDGIDVATSQVMRILVQHISEAAVV